MSWASVIYSDPSMWPSVCGIACKHACVCVVFVYITNVYVLYIIHDNYFPHRLVFLCCFYFGMREGSSESM